MIRPRQGKWNRSFRHRSFIARALQTFAIVLAGEVGDPVATVLAQPADAGTVTERTTLQGHVGRIIRVRYGSDGTDLATASFDGTVRIWDTEKGTERLALNVRPGGRAFDVALSPDGSMIATAGDDWYVRIWDTATGRELKTLGSFNEEVASVLFAPDGKTLLVGSGRHDPRYGRSLEKGGNGHGTLWFFDPESGQERFPSVRSHSSRISHLWFAPDGQHLITAAPENTVKVWRWSNDSSPSEIRSILIGTNPQDMVLDIAVSPDAKTLAVVCQPSAVALYDLETGRKQPPLPIVSDGWPISWDCVAFSRDGKQLLLGGVLQEVSGDQEVVERSEIRVYDLTTLSLTNTFTIDEVIRTIAISPDGREMSAGCGGRQRAPNRQRESEETVVESRGVVFRWDVNE